MSAAAELPVRAEAVTLDGIRELASALEFYADADSYEPQSQRTRPVIVDGGDRAREALAQMPRGTVTSTFVGDARCTW